MRFIRNPEFVSLLVRGFAAFLSPNQCALIIIIQDFQVHLPRTEESRQSFVASELAEAVQRTRYEVE